MVRVHPTQAKQAEKIVKTCPEVEHLRKDKTLHELYGSDNKEAMEDFAMKLNGNKEIKRG